MPRKQTTFADKMKKEKEVFYCAKCGGAKQSILYVESVKSDTGSWKFRERQMEVCKCNQAEIYK